MSLKIAIQGIETSFHDVAARKYFGDDIQLVECNSFKLLCDSLKNGDCDYAVMAIENSIAGSLLANYSYLQDYHFNIAGEVFLNIQLHLMVYPGVMMDDIKYIESHPIAIRQCSRYLNLYPDKEVLEKRDTAECAKDISEGKLKNTAAIANKAAAKKFGLDIIESRIETNKLNFTRFFILSKQLHDTSKANKATIYFELIGKAGSLAEVLNIFKEKNINLTKIQSIPVIGKPYEYAFHVDIEWECGDSYAIALKEVGTITEGLTLLGKYEKATYKIDD